MTQPSPIASVMSAGEVGVGQQQPAPRRDAVGLVVETSGELLGQVLQHGRPQQAGVDRGDAVGAVRADDGQVGHPDCFSGASSIRLTAPDAVLVAGMAARARRRGSGG